jgi:hypothetical protein
MRHGKAYRLTIEAPSNGRLRKATITVLDDQGKVQHTDRADLAAAGEREKLVKRLVARFHQKEKDLRDLVEAAWNELMEQRREQQAAEQAATANPATPPPNVAGYLVHHGCIARLNQMQGSQPLPVALCNFNARIVEEVIRDDGVERNALLAIEGVHADGRPLGRAEVTADEFPGMSWPVPAWGTRAVVGAGQGTKDHLRAALQHLSGDVPRRLVYTHTGWRQINGAWHYLHAAGAIGPGAGIVVELPDDLRNFQLPVPPAGQDCVTAVRASLALLDGLAANKIIYPLLASAYRAALGGTDFSVHVVGPTGSFKTAICALIQQHFGAGMDARDLPGSWSSTGNALELLTFYAKDTVLVVDDFAPAGSTSDVARFHREADRLLRAQGNRSGRQRMRSDGTLRPTRKPRGIVVSTGEDRPRGHSIQARLSIIEVAQGDISQPRLTDCQHDAATGLYAQTMAAFVSWIAPQYDAIGAEVHAAAERFRGLAYRETQHRRTAAITAELETGWMIFLRFAREAGAITAAESNQYWNTALAALGELADRQAAHHESADPAKQFLRLLTAVLASGLGHLASKEGGCPVTAAGVYGWRNENGNFVPQGRQIGWVVEGHVFLEPEAAFAEAQKLANVQGESLPVSPTTLHKRLHEQNLLASVDDKRERLLVRRSLGSAVRTVLDLRPGGLPLPETGQTGQTGHGDP